MEDEKLAYMTRWAAQQGGVLQVKGTVGFMRPCVGVTVGSSYLDFLWYEMDWRNQGRPTLWTPEDAYHKHPCMAVLVHGDDYEKALIQLHEWIKWCDENGWGCVITDRKTLNEPGTFGAELELRMNGPKNPELRPL